MSNRGYIGIDNGVTGSLALVCSDQDRQAFMKVPTVVQQSYTKTDAKITRIDFPRMVEVLSALSNGQDVRVFIERPFVNPKGFKATVSALRALEATLIAVESLGLSHQYIDSKEWQKVMLPKGVKGTPALKLASHDIGVRLFPEFEDSIDRHGDADSLLIAEWARRSGL